MNVNEVLKKIATLDLSRSNIEFEINKLFTEPQNLSDDESTDEEMTNAFYKQVKQKFVIHRRTTL